MNTNTTKINFHDAAAEVENPSDHMVVATERATFGGISVVINRDAADRLRAGFVGDVFVGDDNVTDNERAYPGRRA